MSPTKKPTKGRGRGKRGPDKKPRKRRSDAKKPLKPPSIKPEDYKPPVRDDKGRFIKGISGNPYGRSKAIVSSEDRVKYLGPLFPIFAEQLAKKMLDDDPKTCLGALNIYRQCAIPSPDNEKQAGGGVIEQLIIQNINMAESMNKALEVNAPNVATFNLPEITESQEVDITEEQGDE